MLSTSSDDDEEAEDEVSVSASALEVLVPALWLVLATDEVEGEDDDDDDDFHVEFALTGSTERTTPASPHWSTRDVTREVASSCSQLVLRQGAR